MIEFRITNSQEGGDVLCRSGGKRQALRTTTKKTNQCDEPVQFAIKVRLIWVSEQLLLTIDKIPLPVVHYFQLGTDKPLRNALTTTRNEV